MIISNKKSMSIGNSQCIFGDVNSNMSSCIYHGKYLRVDEGINVMRMCVVSYDIHIYVCLLAQARAH